MDFDVFLNLDKNTSVGADSIFIEIYSVFLTFRNRYSQKHVAVLAEMWGQAWIQAHVYDDH